MHAPINIIQKVSYRSFKNFNEESYRNDIAYLPLQVAEIFDDVDDKLWCQQSLINSIIEEHAPLKTKTVQGKQAPYMNGELRKAINVKGMLKRKYTKFKSRSAWNMFKAQRNKVNSLKRKAVKSYFDKKCNVASKTNAKSFWDTVKPFFSDKKRSNGQCISLLEENKVVSDSVNVANIFNNFFVDAARDLSEPENVKKMLLPKICEHYANHESIMEIQKRFEIENFCFKPVDCDTVKRKLNVLKVNKACGYDKIPASLLKCASEELCQSYTHIINASIKNSVFPSDLKHAEVSPIFKKQDSLLKENYRPVSILTASSKIFECIMCDQMTEFFATKMSPTLSGFRKKYSCENVLLSCVENWRNALDKNDYVGCVLMDLSKAFDSLPHGLLLAKLRAYGMSVDACSMVASYLAERKQRVKLGNSCSEWQEMERGVPQGSLAGPLLFNIFINDLIFFLESKCDVYNYADDNTLSYHHADPKVVKDVLEKSSTIAIRWFRVNHMKANPGKFQAMVLSRANHINLTFEIGNTVIKPSTSVRLLGVNIDEKLNFNEHIAQLCKKAGKQVNAMSRLSNVLGKDSKLSILKSFVLSNFNYCPLVYHICGKGNSLKMERLLERGLRIVSNDFSSPIESLMNEAGVCTLFCSRVKLLAEHVFKVTNNLSPQVQSDFYVVKNVPYNFRNETIMVQPKFYTKTYGFNSVSYLGAKLWNLLPNFCRKLDTVQHFKQFLRQWDGLQCCGQCHLCFI